MAVMVPSPEATALLKICERAIARGYRAGAAGLSNPGPGFDSGEVADLLVRDIHEHLKLGWPISVPA